MRLVIAVLIAAVVLFAADAAEVRIKDIASIKGVMDEQLFGIGLVTGLSGTGDKSGVVATDQMISNLIKNYGLKLPDGTTSTKNNALVLVTATLPPFLNVGDKMSVTVSALGDAKSLRGGTLLFTELRAADWNVYATAQGPVSVGGFDEGKGGPGGNEVKKGVPTVGRVPEGASIVNEVPREIVDPGNIIYISLKNGDFTTAKRVSEAINEKFKSSSYPTNPSTISVKIPDEYADDTRIVAFVSEIENLTVTPAQKAKVVINERTGTIIAGGTDAKVTACHITHGALVLSIESTPEVSQPLPFSGGVTTLFQKIFVEVQDKPGSTLDLKEGATAGEVAQLLTEMKVSPNDIITIFQMLEESGNLQAELIIQ